MQNFNKINNSGNISEADYWNKIFATYKFLKGLIDGNLKKKRKRGQLQITDKEKQI